jgi:hypothetical protein
MLYIYACYIFNECTSFVISHVRSMIPKWIQHRFLLPPKVAINNGTLSFMQSGMNFIHYICELLAISTTTELLFQFSGSELLWSVHVNYLLHWFFIWISFIFSYFLADLTGAFLTPHVSALPTMIRIKDVYHALYRMRRHPRR